MLRELHITNLAVIEDLSLVLDDGLNCFTGQTGAGKSLILGAFELLLGLRAPAADMLRPQAAEGRVSGLFELHDPELASQVAEVLDCGHDFDGQVLVTRKLFASGRSSTTVNGQPAVAAMLRQLGELLVDIHGQHDHQYLLKPSNQMAILDRFGACGELRRQFAELHSRRRRLLERREELDASARLRQQQLDLAVFQAQEIDAAAPQEGELPELQARHRVLSNVQRLAQDAGQVHGALYDAEGSVLERLAAMVHVLGNLSELDEDLAAIHESVKGAALTLQEAAFDLGRYVNRLELDPAELADVEDRLNTLNRLAGKYAGRQAGEDPIAAVLALREELEQQIRRLRADEADAGDLDRQVQRVTKELGQVGRSLSAARQAAAAKLGPLVDAQLADLGMTEAALHVEFTPCDTVESAEPGGLESIELMVRTNPGQPARPLRKIASGGELSRIMLALKSILADSDRINVLVFDEIDANIGGRMGTVIGQKLRELSRGGQPGGATRHQVLCITHLPQIAVYADRHLRVAKNVAQSDGAKQTFTTVAALDGKQRIDELAEMLAGKQVSKTTRQQVQEMLAAAG